MQGIFQKIIFFLIMICMNIIFDMFTHFIYDHIISYIHLTPVITIGGFWGGGGRGAGGVRTPSILNQHPFNHFQHPSIFLNNPHKRYISTIFNIDLYSFMKIFRFLDYDTPPFPKNSVTPQFFFQNPPLFITKGQKRP